MDNWIVKRAQADPALAASALALRAQAETFWNELRLVLRRNVEEFNALYGSQPDRVAEISEEEARATIRLKANPRIYAEVAREDLRFVCRFSTGRDSQLASEFRIFGDWDSTRVLSFVAGMNGAGVRLSGDRVMDAMEAGEFIMSPVLFPA